MPTFHSPAKADFADNSPSREREEPASAVAAFASVDADYDNGGRRLPRRCTQRPDGADGRTLVPRVKVVYEEAEASVNFYRLQVGPRKLGQRRMWRSGQRSGRTARWIWAWRSSSERRRRLIVSVAPLTHRTGSLHTLSVGAPALTLGGSCPTDPSLACVSIFGKAAGIFP